MSLSPSLTSNRSPTQRACLARSSLLLGTGSSIPPERTSRGGSDHQDHSDMKRNRESLFWKLGSPASRSQSGPSRPV